MKHFLIVGYKSVTRSGAPAELKKLNEAADKADKAAVKAQKDIKKVRELLSEQQISNKDYAEKVLDCEKIIKAGRLARATASSFEKNMNVEVCKVIDCGNDKEAIKEKFEELRNKKSEFDLIRIIDDSSNLKQARPRDLDEYQKQLAEKKAKEEAEKAELLKVELAEKIKKQKAELAEDQARLAMLTGDENSDDDKDSDPEKDSDENSGSENKEPEKDQETPADKPAAETSKPAAKPKGKAAAKK